MKKLSLLLTVLVLAFSVQATVQAGNQEIKIKKHASTALTQSRATTVIVNQPEGELVTYNRAGMSIFTGYFGVQSSPFADKMNLVFGTDGKV